MKARVSEIIYAIRSVPIIKIFWGEFKTSKQLWTGRSYDLIQDYPHEVLYGMIIEEIFIVQSSLIIIIGQ